MTQSLRMAVREHPKQYGLLRWFHNNTIHCSIWRPVPVPVPLPHPRGSSSTSMAAWWTIMSMSCASIAVAIRLRIVCCTMDAMVIMATTKIATTTTTMRTITMMIAEINHSICVWASPQYSWQPPMRQWVIIPNNIHIHIIRISSSYSSKYVHSCHSWCSPVPIVDTAAAAAWVWYQ